jgi:hypothetical protein
MRLSNFDGAIPRFSTGLRPTTFSILLESAPPMGAIANSFLWH